MTRVLRALIRAGWNKGVRGGSRPWLMVGAVALLGELARRGLSRREEVIWSGPVAPGQVVTVRHLAAGED